MSTRSDDGKKSRRHEKYILELLEARCECLSLKCLFCIVLELVGSEVSRIRVVVTEIQERVKYIIFPTILVSHEFRILIESVCWDAHLFARLAVDDVGDGLGREDIAIEVEGSESDARVEEERHTRKIWIIKYIVISSEIRGTRIDEKSPH